MIAKTSRPRARFAEGNSFPRAVPLGNCNKPNGSDDANFFRSPVSVKWTNPPLVHKEEGSSHAYHSTFPCAVEPGRQARLAVALAETGQALTLICGDNLRAVILRAFPSRESEDMSSRKISHRALRSSCADVGAGDGCDPRLDRREGTGKVPNRKALQLCAQVARALAGVFADCGEDLLRDLLIESVTPAPNASRLLVTVRPAVPMESPVVLARLEHARAKLRTETVAAIHRRRAPDLLFRVSQSER